MRIPTRKCPQCDSASLLRALIPFEGDNKALAYLACTDPDCRCHINETWELAYVVKNAANQDKILSSSAYPPIFVCHHAHEKVARLVCPCCGQSARFIKGEALSDGLTRRYGRCKDSSCQTSFVCFCSLDAYTRDEALEDAPILNVMRLMFDEHDREALTALALHEQKRKAQMKQQQEDRQRIEQEKAKAEQAQKRGRDGTPVMVTP